VSFFGSIGSAISGAVKGIGKAVKVAAPIAAVGALAVPGLGPAVSAGIGALGRMVAQVQTSAATANDTAGSIPQSFATGYLQAAPPSQVASQVGLMHPAVLLGGGALISWIIFRPRGGSRRY
jgi:hypothetical protein